MPRTSIGRLFEKMPEDIEQLIAMVDAIMSDNKGVLGLDQHSCAFDHIFSELNCPNDPENRRLYRQFLCSAPLQDVFSVAILSEEFISQSDDESTDFTDILQSKGLNFGVRVDTGLTLQPGSSGDFIGTGMHRITERLVYYKERGCNYSKWRSAYQLKEIYPTVKGTDINSYDISKFAALSQNIGLVPIISVELLPDGTMGIKRAQKVLEKILSHQIKALNDYDVVLEATILQVSFVQPGRQSANPECLPEKIAELTLECFTKSLPVAVGGILFHSSGLSEENATLTLNELTKKQRTDKIVVPWKMKYSFGRAQQTSAIKLWNFDPDMVEEGHKQIIIRAAANNQALTGEYEAGTVRGYSLFEDLYVPNYTH